jgi:hypothetical protein
VLLEDVQQNHELQASAVEDSIERTAVVATEFAQLTVDLGTMRKCQMGVFLIERIDAIDLPVDCKAN